MELNSRWIEYFNGKKENKNWIITEKEFCPFNQGKFETIFSQGNGYIGTRAILEEDYPNKHHGLYVASTFNQVSGPEVSELPNAANIWDAKIILNGEQFNMLIGEVLDYSRTINLKNGEVVRVVKWKSPKGEIFNLKFEKFVSMDNIHLMVQRITIKPEVDAKVKFFSGIDAQQTNSGAQHFEDTDATYFDGVLEYVLTTTESQIDFIWNKNIKYLIDGEEQITESRVSSVYGYNRRTLTKINELSVAKDKELVMEAFTLLNTSRDIEYHENEITREELREKSKSEIMNLISNSYDDLKGKNDVAWNDYWNEMSIEIDTEDDWDIISTRFAQYQIRRFTPMHDWRANIEAKGFAGEEYKGHTFWDTEIFIWPYFLYTNPKVARNLMKHRYFVRNAAYIKGEDQGYEGMMWPWETTWHDKGETCPVWGAVDRREGKRIKVWPAFNQLHIGACITWALFQYYATTKDHEFMNKYGFEVFFDTARFWTNRLEHNKDLDRYEITKITGPNEYKENIDNNAWTNYMVWFNLSKSLEYIKQIKDTEVFNKINESINLVELEEKINSIVDKIYLPQPNEEGIIPENDTFLQLEDVNMKYYKEHIDEFWTKYTFPEQNKLQTLKQADIVALFYTLGFLFDNKTIEKNWKYYEERCLHDSSLSLSMHTITANYAEDKSFAYDFFKKSSAIDLGTDMDSCNNGIHAASIGGMLQAVIVGFGGIKNQNGKFIISPNLPKAWNSIKFNFYLEGEKIETLITHTNISFKKEDNGKEVKFTYNNNGTEQEVTLINELTI